MDGVELWSHGSWKLKHANTKHALGESWIRLSPGDFLGARDEMWRRVGSQLAGVLGSLRVGDPKPAVIEIRKLVSLSWPPLGGMMNSVSHGVWSSR